MKLLEHAVNKAVMEQLVVEGLHAFREFCLTFGQMYFDSIDNKDVSPVTDSVRSNIVDGFKEEADKLLETEYPYQSNKLAIAIYNKNEKIFWLMMKICISSKYYIWYFDPDQAINEYINVIKLSMNNNT